MTDPQTEEVEASLREFLQAFENCDLETMDKAFASDCLSFPQIIASPSVQIGRDLSPFKRCQGMPEDMRRVALELPKNNAGPPFQSLVPKDLSIQMFGKAAVATFHLEREGSLGRRTIVFARRDEQWRIVHLHASRVESDWRRLAPDSS